MWNPARRAEAGANATNQPHAPQIIRQSTTAGPCTPRSWGRGLGERGRGLRAPLSRCHPGPDMGQCMVSVYRLRGHVIHAYYGLDHAMGLGFMATRRQRIQVVMATPGTQMRDSARCGGDGAANGCGPSPPTPPQNTGTSSRHSRRREVDNCTTIRSITRPMIRRATLTRRVLVLLRARAGGGGGGKIRGSNRPPRPRWVLEAVHSLPTQEMETPTEDRTEQGPEDQSHENTGPRKTNVAQLRALPGVREPGLAGSIPIHNRQHYTAQLSIGHTTSHQEWSHCIWRGHTEARARSVGFDTEDI